MINLGNVITITYSWHKNYKHGICGHTYEAIEYYYILSKFYECKILLVDLDIDVFRSAIENKYSFSTEEVQDIISSTVFKNTEEVHDKKIISEAVLVLDGFYYPDYNPFITSNLSCFACYVKDLYKFNIKNLSVLQDDRIYDKSYNTINYVKKILFDKIKKPREIQRERPISLLYTTTGCRKFDISKYSPNDVVCLTNGTKLQGYTYLKMPVKNIFECFDKYIYTPVSTEFDCSPRFIAECKYFGKEVVYDIDYYDIGLETRKKDLENLESLHLREDDYIVEFFKEVRCKKNTMQKNTMQKIRCKK